MKRFLICILFSSCTVGPNFVPPDNNVQDCWNAPTEDAFTLDSPDCRWWEVFDDELLTCYINEGALFNKDVQIAEANLLNARAARDYASSYFYPRISHDMNVSRQKFSQNGPLFNLPNANTPGLSPTIAVPQYQTLYNFNFDAIWELDVFGKTRRSVEAADANIGVALANLNDVMLSLFAEIAKNYVEVRAAQEQQRLIEKNLALLKQNVDLTTNRVKGGLENALNQDRVEAEYETLLATLPQTYTTIYSGIYNLSILIGRVPETLLCEMLPYQPMPCIPEKVALGLRSEILQRRPDVRGAENALHQATANIGVAYAEFFPKFTLTGLEGFQSLQLKKLFQGKSNLWSYSADITTPIFEGGRLRANLAMAKAQNAEQVAQYEKTVLNALRDAERALVAYAQDLEALKSLQQVTSKNEKIVFLSKNRYQKGLTNLTDFIDAERQLINTENNLLITKQQTLIDLISLYKALGGCF